MRDYHLFRYEARGNGLIKAPAFALRMVAHAGLALAITVLPLIGGIWGFVRWGKLDPIDAFLNSAMLLGGMGPVGDLGDDQGKIFAGVYALFAGLFYIAAMGVMLAPVIHRVAHVLHQGERNVKK